MSHIPARPVLYENGRLEVYRDDEKGAIEMLDEGALQAWSFGPILVEDGKAFSDFSEISDLALPNPRTGIRDGGGRALCCNSN